MSSPLDSLPPGTQPATDVVSTKILINGTELSGELAISFLTISQSFNKISFAKLGLLDGSPSTRSFERSNDNRFKPGNEITIQLGYHGEVQTVFEGIIIKHGIKVRQHSSVLLLEVKDKAIRLTGARKCKYFINKTDHQIMTTLAGDLRKTIDPINFEHKQQVQYYTTDWDYLVARAEANGMLVYTDNGNLVVKKPVTTTAPVCTFTYGQNIWELEAEMDVRNQKQQVSSRSWDFTRQTLEPPQTGSSSFSESGNLSSSELAGVMGATVTLLHPGNLTQTQLKDWSDAHALRTRLSKVCGRIRVKGKAEIKPGVMITLAGMGDRFNGNVFVTGVLHHYQGLWQSDIQFGWKEDWFYKKESVIERPSSGLVPGINGLLIGIVKSVSDTENGGQYRVQVHNPLITTSDEGIWARVATLDAGADRGSYFRPQTNDEVVMGFLNDDPREPIILGYLHSKDAHKSPLPSADNVLESGFVTKEGVKLIFDDTNKRMTMRVPAGSGEKSVVLNSSSSALELKDEHGNSIKLDSSGITIQAGSGKNVTVSGTQIRLN